MLALLHPKDVAKWRHVDEAVIWNDYADTARHLAVVLNEEQPLFAGEFGRAKTAAVLISLAKWETGFRNELTGDGGRSHCMLSIMAGRTGRVREGSGQELRKDKALCFKAGLRIARQSFGACRGKMMHKLAAYASGSCTRGLSASKIRMIDVLKLWKYPQLSNEIFAQHGDQNVENEIASD